MSVYTSVYALDSKIKAPEIGDHGCIGFPPVSSEDDRHDFLRIYEGLRMAGLATKELDSFYAFIEEYKKKRLYFDIEGSEGEDASRLNQILEDLYDKGEEIPVFELPDNPTYTKARYKISSGPNELVSNHTDFFLNTDSFSIDKDSLSKLIEEVFEVPDWESSFYRVWGLLDPYDGDLGKIREFIVNNPGPFTVEYLTDDFTLPETSPNESPIDPEQVENQAQVHETLKEIKPADTRSTLVKIRDSIILLFFIWLGIRIIYHLYMYFSQ